MLLLLLWLVELRAVVQVEVAVAVEMVVEVVAVLQDLVSQVQMEEAVAAMAGLEVMMIPLRMPIS